MEGFKRASAKIIIVTGMIIIGLCAIGGIIVMCDDEVGLGFLIILGGIVGGVLFSCIGVIADHLADIKDMLEDIGEGKADENLSGHMLFNNNNNYSNNNNNNNYSNYNNNNNNVGNVNSWKCSNCGKVNAHYVGSCGCGKSRYE